MIKRKLIPSVKLRIGHTSIVMGASWLLVAPLGLGTLGMLYVPIMAPFLSPIETWGVALGIMGLVEASLVAHVLAHAGAAWLVAGRDRGQSMPSDIPLYPFGDAAQVWPAGPTPRREMLVAIAGPLANFLLAGLAYLVWNQQWHSYLNVSMIFLTVVNVSWAAMNLAPGFPFDGGRLVRSTVWDLVELPAESTRLALWLGRLMAISLAGWGLMLLFKRVRFSLEIGASTLFTAGLLLWALWEHPAWQRDGPQSPVSPSPGGTGSLAGGKIIRGLVAALIILALAGVASSLVPTVNGLHAPGFAIPVEPMVIVAPEHRHPYSGSFILTSVISQTPIIAGQWVYAQLSPVVEIVPPERIVPPDITPQELMEQNFKLLEESETLATVVALRLAGYDVRVIGEAVKVTSILPESPAHGVLQINDLILRLNGEPANVASELAARIRALDPNDTVNLVIDRAGQPMELTLPLMQPSDPNEPPRLGITIETVGLDVELPFEVEVRPKKIAGGPSAGLMFTLTIYNLITPGDLTGGRKIAGTGTINLDGKVGPIGGVEQKVAGAERAGAEYFLVPLENYEDAQRVARKIKVIKVETAQEAIDFLRGLPPANSQEETFRVSETLKVCTLSVDEPSRGRG
jgi:PDZ domain-containing protein